jgi:predicted TIM-barrel fold metal-dependent hydrolase
MRAKPADPIHAGTSGEGTMLEDSSRRQFLTGVAAAGAAVAIPSGLGWAQTAAKAPKPKHHGVIDLHHHFWSPDYLKLQDGWEDAHHAPHVPAMQAWSPQMSIDEMDKNGVKTSVVSLASISEGFWGADPQAATAVIQASDDYAARMMSDHPGRFGLFAPLNMIDNDTSLKEIAYAFDQVHADGIGLQSSYNGKYLGDASYDPIWQELDHRKAVVFVHGPNSACCSQIKDGPGMFGSVVEVTFDVTRAAASLLSSGTLHRYPNIQWIIAYGGGTLPFVAGRINAFLKQMKNVNDFAPNGVVAELQKLHLDTVNVTNEASMAALQKFVKSTQIVYGTDFIYFNNDQLDALDERHLSAKDHELILSGNAKRLIPRLAKA